MASDPLSSTTHKARTYLLGLSAAGLLTHYYGLTVEDIPLAGLKIDVTDNLVPLALTIGIGYFLVSFLIYAVDDVINLSNTPYQERIVSAFSEQREVIRKDTISTIALSLSSSGTITFVNKKDEIPDNESIKMATTIWERSVPLFALDEDQFERTVKAMLEVDFHITSDNKVRGEWRFGEFHFKEAMDVLMNARQAINYHRKIGVSRSYTLYRRFRIWVFDLALPPVVGICVLATMWWPIP